MNFSEQTQKLLDLQEKAKAAKKGRWSEDDPQLHVRNIQWVVDDMQAVLNEWKKKEIDVVIEQVHWNRKNSVNLPSVTICSRCETEALCDCFCPIASISPYSKWPLSSVFRKRRSFSIFRLSGVKSPSVRVGNEGSREEFGEEAKFFVETRILQRDVKLILEGISNQNFMGSVIHPRGNIAEFLLKEGYAKCVEWSLGLASGGAQAFRDAERYAKERKLRLWKGYTGPAQPVDRKAISGKVVELGLVDNMTVRLDNGQEMKIFLSSLRPPRRDGPAANSGGAAPQQPRPLFDTPFMFEAREFLRKRLIGKRVNVVVDYVQVRAVQKYHLVAKTVNFSQKQNPSPRRRVALSPGMGRMLPSY